MVSFTETVYRYVATIPRGKVMTYGGVASAIGHPRAARAVGTALSRNPYPYSVEKHRRVAIPCHRVVRADGHLGGYNGGLAKKRALLGHEGVVFAGDRVDRRSIVVPTRQR